MHELCVVLSQTIVDHLHAILFHDSHQDSLDDLITKIQAYALSGAQPEPPIGVTVLGGEEFTEPIRSEYVSVHTPNWGITVEGVGVDEDGGPGWDVVPADGLWIGCQFREGIEYNRVQTTGFEVAVMEEGVGLANVCVGPIFAVGTEGFV